MCKAFVAMASISLDNHLEDFNYTIKAVQIRGYQSRQNVVNFLNIPYAKSSVRFKPAVPLALHDLPSPYTATRYGPRCPQDSGTLHLAMKHLFEKVSMAEQLSEEFTSLNLNIYTPPLALNNDSCRGLPVFVWIHGGAFNTGDNTVQFGSLNAISKNKSLTFRRRQSPCEEIHGGWQPHTTSRDQL